MLNRKQYRIIKDGITDGTYKRIRLVRIKDNEEREMLTTFNGYIKGGEENAVKRLDYIKHQLEKVLPAGSYVIEATTTPTGNGGIVDSFKVNKLPVNVPIDNGTALQERIEDHRNTQENMPEFDIDEFKDLLQKISNLEVTVQVQKLQIQALTAELANRPLNDSAGSSTINSVMKLAEEHLPSVVGIFDTFLKQKEESNKLKDRELTLQENGNRVNGKFKKKKMIAPEKSQKSKEEILSEMEDLYDQDEASFNATLADMEEKDPELAAYINEQMFDDSEEEEEEEN
jgi:hypothetical protein